MAAKLTKACNEYLNWKSKQAKPDFKPWRNPNQLSTLPRLDSKDVLSMDEVRNDEGIDETAITEEKDNGANGNENNDED